MTNNIVLTVVNMRDPYVLIAIWGLILLLFKLLIEIIVFAVGCTALAPLAKKKYYRGSDGHIYSKSDLDDTYHRED